MLIFAKRCAAVVGLTAGLASWAAAQQDADRFYPGQAEVAAATDLDLAIDQLYGYALTVEEVDYFINTMVSLEAWARVNQYAVKGCFETMPVYEAIHSLGFWQEVDRSSMPFATVYSKILLAYLYADPAQNVLANTKEYIAKTTAQSVDPDLTEPDQEFAKRQLIEARAHLALLETIPEGNGPLYASLQTFIDPALEHFAWLPEIKGEAPEIFTLSSIGLRARGSGVWSRNESVAHQSYHLTWPACSLDLMSVPWVAGVEIDDETIGALVAGALTGSPDVKIDGHVYGEVNGRKDARLRYHNPVENTQGLAYLTTANERLYILLYDGTDEQWDLLQPIIKESYTQLEFGEYPMPLLEDRSPMGYQIYAEAPWRVQLDRPVDLDMRLVHGSSPMLVDISVFSADLDSISDAERFAKIVDQIHATSLEDYVNPQVVQAGVVEFHGLACGISDIYGIQKTSAEAEEPMTLHQRQLFVHHGKGFLHFNIQANHLDWADVAPIAEQLLQNVKFVEVKQKVLLDQSAKGSRWKRA